MGTPLSLLVPEVDREFLRVPPEKLAEVLKRIRLGDRLRQWHLEDIHPLAQSVFSQRYATNAKQNARTSLVIPRVSVTHYPMIQQKISLDAQARGKVVFAVQLGHYRLKVEDAETPDPFALYFAQHACGVKVHDAYGHLIRSGEGAIADSNCSGTRLHQRHKH